MRADLPEIPGLVMTAGDGKVTVSVADWNEMQAQLRHRGLRNPDRTAEVLALRRVVNHYRNCQHGCIDCFCTKEARAALAPGGASG